MTTEPQSTTQAPLNTSLRRTSEWNVYLIKGGGEGIEASKRKQLEPWSPPTNIPGKTAALARFQPCLNHI